MGKRIYCEYTVDTSSLEQAEVEKLMQAGINAEERKTIKEEIVHTLDSIMVQCSSLRHRRKICD
jgi:hypothetical protein